MIKESRLSRYLLYAIGEIILVVIGILIALQINTYNKELQTRKLEHVSLESLKSDLLLQKEIILKQIKNESDMKVKSDSARLFIDNRLRPDELYLLLTDLSYRLTFIANKATFQNMGSTGDVVLIHNKDLQNAVVRYYQELDYTTAVINNNNLFLIDSHFAAFVANNSLGFQCTEKGSIDNKYQMSSEKRFTLMSQLDGRDAASESIKRLCTILLDSTEKLISLIDTEITEDGRI